MKLSTPALVGAPIAVAIAAAVWMSGSSSNSAATPTPPVADPPAAPAPVPVAPAPPPATPRAQFVTGRTLMLEGRLGHPVLPAATDTETFLYVDVSADAGRTAAHVPLELAIVVDKSGSMKGKRLANALAATRKAIERLRDGDTVSVVTYDTTATVVVAPTRIDAAARARVLRELARPRAGGDTCISCGLEAATSQLGRRTGVVRRVLLLSDGLATAGVRDLPGFRRVAEDVRALGASITTIGVDVDYDERIMAALARDSNGNHAFVADPSGLPAIFDREMASLTRTVADATELVVDLAPGVVADRVFDRNLSASGSQVVIPLGTFTAGEKKTALLRLRVPRGPAGERPIAAVRLRFDDLVDQRPGTCEGTLVAVASADPAQVAPLDGVVSARVSSSETAATLEQANELVRRGEGEAAARILRDRAAEVQAEKAVARTASPAAAPRLDEAFAKQEAALTGASAGFAPATPSAAPPKPSDRKAKAGIRASQADAFDLGR